MSVNWAQIASFRNGVGVCFFLNTVCDLASLFVMVLSFRGLARQLKGAGQQEVASRQQALQAEFLAAAQGALKLVLRQAVAFHSDQRFREIDRAIHGNSPPRIEGDSARSSS